MRIKGLGKLRWPWHAVVVTPAERAPLVMLNRYPGQIIGIAFRLPDEPVYNQGVHKQLSILWARPDVEQYPADWDKRPRRDVLFGTRNPLTDTGVVRVADPDHEIRSE